MSNSTTPVPGSPRRPIRNRTPAKPPLPANENITYDFVFDDGLTHHFEVPFQGWTETPETRDQVHPEWTLLANDQCPNCPLDRATHKYCPAAVDLHAAATKFGAIASYKTARITVTVGSRTFASACDMNTGLRSLFGLYMALSGCPITRRMRPMALRHLPFATMEETLSRTVSHYLLKQYFVMKAGSTPDWELKGLLDLYQQLDAVNGAFVNRVRHASERDSNLNAICGLLTFARLYTMALDDLLAEDKALFLSGF